MQILPSHHQLHSFQQLVAPSNRTFSSWWSEGEPSPQVGRKVQDDAVDFNPLFCKFCEKEYVYRIWGNIEEMRMDIETLRAVKKKGLLNHGKRITEI